MRPLVFGNPGPVKSFRRRFRIGMGRHDVAEKTLGFFEVLTLERCVSGAELQVREKIRGGEEAFDPVCLFTIRVELKDGRRPL